MKKLIYAWIFAFVLISCIEDPADGIVSLEEREVVNVPFSFNVTQTILGRNDFSEGIPFTVQLPGVNDTRELRITSPITVGEISETIIVLDTPFFASETITLDSLTFDFDYPTIGFGATGSYTARVSGVRLLEEVVVDGDTLLAPSGEDEVSLQSDFVDPPLVFYDRVALNNEEQLNVLVDWTLPGFNDVDLSILLIENMDTTVISSGATSNRYESASIENTAGNETYDVVLNIFSSGADPISSAIPYRLFLALPDGSREVFEGELPAGIELETDVSIGSITKSGEIYTFNQ